MFICIFVISHNCMIPGVEQSEVCYKTQRLAALPRQLQGDGTCMSGAVQCLPRGSLTPVGLAGWPLPAWHLPVIGNPGFPCKSILAASGEGKGSGCLRYVRYLMGMTEWDGDLASVRSKLSASGPVLYFLPTSVPAGRQRSQAEDWAAPGGPARLGCPPGGLVRDGSGCSWWRWRICGREGGGGKGSVQSSLCPLAAQPGQ